MKNNNCSMIEVSEDQIFKKKGGLWGLIPPPQKKKKTHQVYH